MGYLPLRLAVSGRILGADHVTQPQCRPKGARGGVGWGGPGRAGQGRATRTGAQPGRVQRGGSALCGGAVLSTWTAGEMRRFHVLFHRALPHASFSHPACGARWASTPARRRPTNQPTSREDHKLRPPGAAKLKATPGLEPADLFWADLARSRRESRLPTAAVSLNSGATPAPRRARLGSDGSPREAGAHRGLRERTTGWRRAHHAPEPAPERKEPPRARALPLSLLRKRPRPFSPTSNRREEAGRPRSDSGEAIKGTAGSAARSFASGPRSRCS